MARSKQHSGRDDVMGKVALGATGVALAAGGIAAAALLTNRNSRTTVRKAAGNTFKKIGGVKHAFQGGVERFQTYQHRIGIGKKKTATGKSGAKKSSRGRKSSPAVLHEIGMGKNKKSTGGMMKKSAHAGNRKGRK